MRISELSRQSGVSVATIKFYLREGLLERGRPTGRNQAEYGPAHLARLRLVRVLVGFGQLSLSSVRDVLAAVDNHGLSLQGLCHVVNRVLFAEPTEPTGASEVDEVGVARALVDEFVGSLGWQVDLDAPGRAVLAQALAALRRLGWDCDADIFLPYALAASELAAYERDRVPGRPAGLAGPADTMVARTVIFEVALAALRGMAQEHLLVDRPDARPAGQPPEDADTDIGAPA
jgi:DNA-binding transcriptional MerR regulator